MPRPACSVRGMALAGRAAPELFDRSSRGTLQDLLLNAGANGKPAEINVRLPKTQALAAVSATPFRAGGGLRLLLRVRSAAAPEATASEMNKTLALLVDSTRDGIVVTDSSGRILVANPAFLALVHSRQRRRGARPARSATGWAASRPMSRPCWPVRMRTALRTWCAPACAAATVRPSTSTSPARCWPRASRNASASPSGPANRAAMRMPPG